MAEPRDPVCSIKSTSERERTHGHHTVQAIPFAFYISRNGDNGQAVGRPATVCGQLQSTGFFARLA